MTADECVARQCAHENLLAEALAALRWAMAQPGLSYSRRIRGQNDAWCDQVDAAREVLAKADLQGLRG